MAITVSLIFWGIFYCILKWPEWMANNRTPPPGKKSDWNAMNHDLTMGMSKDDFYRKKNSGGYDIPIDK